MTGAELEGHVNLALSAEVEQTRLLGRELHRAEFEWLVMGVFKHGFGQDEGARLARVILDVILIAREEVG